MRVYQGFVEAFNKTSSVLGSADKQNANPRDSQYRTASMDNGYNFNGLKLHELHFGNISDLNSQISLDSVPYIKLGRDFGTFENWQFDFMAACMSSRSGWAMTVWEPYRRVYMNIVVDDNNVGIPLGAVPVIVLDMNEHAYCADYNNERKPYVVAMMRELNWAVIEARMTVAERSQLADLWQIFPLTNDRPEVMLSTASANAMPAPIEADPAGILPPTSGSMQTPPANPMAPSISGYNV